MSLVLDAPRVRSGQAVGVSVVFTNTTGAPLPVDVRAGCTQYELGAYDARGVRRDLVVTDCGFGTGCGGPTTRLVVEPGGTVTKHLRFKARVTRVSARSDCRDADAGGLPPGKYQLRATAELRGWLESLPSGDSPSVSATIEVTR